MAWFGSGAQKVEAARNYQELQEVGADPAPGHHRQRSISSRRSASVAFPGGADQCEHSGSAPGQVGLYWL